MRNMICAALLCASPAFADDAEEAFVEANLLGIFYHELGHAMIDVIGLPVFGQEEDAADVASVFLINSLWDDETAIGMAYDASFGFAAEAMLSDADDVAFWDVHGQDEQRFFNTVCLFYGASPDTRDDFADDMGLPEDRADSCEEEFELAADSWGSVLDKMAESGGKPLTLEAGGETLLTARIIRAEVDALNEEFLWPVALDVRVASCGEANAFYDPNDQSVTVCEEFEDHLRGLFQLSQDPEQNKN